MKAKKKAVKKPKKSKKTEQAPEQVTRAGKPIETAMLRSRGETR